MYVATFLKNKCRINGDTDSQNQRLEQPERDAPKPQRHFPGHQPQMINTQQQGVWASGPRWVTWGRE